MCLIKSPIKKVIRRFPYSNCTCVTSSHWETGDLGRAWHCTFCQAPKKQHFLSQLEKPGCDWLCGEPSRPGYYLQIAAKHWQTDFRVVLAKAKPLYIKVIHIIKKTKSGSLYYYSIQRFISTQTSQQVFPIFVFRSFCSALRLDGVSCLLGQQSYDKLLSEPEQHRAS